MQSDTLATEHAVNDTLHDEEPSAKRIKLDNSGSSHLEGNSMTPGETNIAPSKDIASALPPSRVLLGSPPSTNDSELTPFSEFDVGISDYISKDLPPIHAIIKQRFTDFLVHEVNLDSEVIHVESLEMPSSEVKKELTSTASEQPNTEAVKDALPILNDSEAAAASQTVSTEAEKSDAVDNEGTTNDDDRDAWPDRFNAVLGEFLSEPAIAQLKQMYLEGPEPPLVSDNGWAGRKAKEGTSASADEVQSEPVTASTDSRGKRGKRGRDRGGRGRGRGGRGGGSGREDTRKVLSEPIESKIARTNLHKAVRELFSGKLESETDSKSNNEAGDNRIAIKWGKGGGQGRSGRGRQSSRGNYPPFIHFTLQKTNRDTQDALGHISRMLHTSVKDLSVSGTKDKRGVTVQRVSLKRNGKTVEDVWKMVNNVPGRRTAEEAVAQRGERGVRISDLRYRKASLELGMLKGNVFVITLRNVQLEPPDTIDKAMNSLKNYGFINYYGMQRFGTASVPTHAIGLAFLKSEWHKAIELILQHRPGEHPDVTAARDAWLIDEDLDKALELMPRRVVAERCILESYKKQKGETRNAMGALSTIPRNLRLMYIHAYQSYLWNAIVSERIKTFGYEKPAIGDLVFDVQPGSKLEDEEQDLVDVQPPDDDDAAITKKTRQPWEPPKVKTLTEEDLDKYSIFDVIMPLPGKDVAYPGGTLGERYRKFLEADGLDPDNWVRKQKDYSLGGSYRKILHKPRDLSWSILRYTDPDVPLAQADEDKLLGFEAPVIDEDGKFVALQVKMQLATAAYATMALRELTKTETSAQYQTTLTQRSEDQMFRGSAGGGGGGAEDMEM